jgi:hypothetical protein
MTEAWGTNCVSSNPILKCAQKCSVSAAGLFSDILAAYIYEYMSPLLFIGLLVRVYNLEERQMVVMQSGVVSFTETSRHASLSLKTVRQEMTPCIKTYVLKAPTSSM